MHQKKKRKRPLNQGSQIHKIMARARRLGNFTETKEKVEFNPTDGDNRMMKQPDSIYSSNILIIEDDNGTRFIEVEEIAMITI